MAEEFCDNRVFVRHLSADFFFGLSLRPRWLHPKEVIETGQYFCFTASALLSDKKSSEQDIFKHDDIYFENLVCFLPYFWSLSRELILPDVLLKTIFPRASERVNTCRWHLLLHVYKHTSEQVNTENARFRLEKGLDAYTYIRFLTVNVEKHFYLLF